MNRSIKLAVCGAIALMGSVAHAANVNTLSSSATGSSLILLLKNATDTTYYYAELNKTVSDLRTMADLQSDTPEGYSVYTGEVGPLNEGNIQSLNGYTNANLAAYLADNSSDNITWTIMGSKSAPQATAGAAAFAITSNQDFVNTWFWENQATWTAANFFGTAFITDELNNGAWTNGQSSANGWGSATPNGVGAPVSFNGAGFENGAALGQAQSMYLFATTGGDVANVYKAATTLTLGTNGVMTAYSSVPVPGAVWLLGSGLMGLVGIGRRRKAAVAA